MFISKIDEDVKINESRTDDIKIDQPIELDSEEVSDLDLYLHVNNIRDYQEIKNIVNQIHLTDKKS